MNIKRAFVSVYDKRGIEKLCNFLIENGVEIIATPGTASYLEENGLEVKHVEKHTGFPCVFDGKIKSIHPSIIGGIVGNPDSEKDTKELTENDISPFDIVVVNFRPFEEVVRVTGDEYTLANEMDIGGPTVLVSAVTNMRNVVAVCDPEDYKSVIKNLEYCGDILLQKRRRLALKALYYVAGYFASIHKSFSEIFASEKYDHLTMEYIMPLLHGDTLSQKATLLKMDKEPGLLDNVQVANPSIAPTKTDISNTYKFAELYYYLGDVSAFIINGRVVAASINDSIDRFFSDNNSMYCSTFTIDYPTIKKFHQLGVKSFTGVFNRDAIKYAQENDVMVMTIPEREELMRTETVYTSFEDYIVREQADEVKFPNDFDGDEKLALVTSRINLTVSIVMVKDNKTLIVKSGLIREELEEYIKDTKPLESMVCAISSDLSDDEIEMLKSRGIRSIILPGVSRKYKDPIIKTV